MTEPQPPTLAGVRALMFDFYGTVVDMQGGLTRAVTPFLAERGYEGRPAQLVTWWRRTHFENSMIDALLHREHTPYREIGRRAVSYTLERAGVAHTPEDAERLVAEIERLDPFPDVLEALERLHERYDLTILSNGDPDMLERGVAHAGFPFDARDLRGRGGRVQAASGHVREGGRAARARPRRRSSSWPTTPSTASGPRPSACAARSSTAGGVRSARPRMLPTSSCATSRTSRTC